VILSRGEGVWVWDAQGKRYLDCLSAYSDGERGPTAIRNPGRLVEQVGKLTLICRTRHND
jgi:ornithine--oxo-acid transaminase